MVTPCKFFVEAHFSVYSGFDQRNGFVNEHKMNGAVIEIKATDVHICLFCR